MNMQYEPTRKDHRDTARSAAQHRRTVEGLSAAASSVRLRAALALGSTPDPTSVDATIGALIERCAVEPDFFVRDMLTWALTRYPAAQVVPRLEAELRSDRARARSQALHTLSKIGDGSAWPSITPALLSDADDEVARSAWRAAVILAPVEDRGPLADLLVGQLGRGDGNVQRSLSRALVALGGAADTALAGMATHADPDVRAHARATTALAADPEAGFDAVLADAKRIAALGPGAG